MEASFHFLFELIKISILASIYATLTLLIFRMIGNYKPGSWCSRITKRKMRFWLLSGFAISVWLFFYMFTYFGDHGLGDSSKVPIGHFKVVRQINGTDSYIENSKGEQLGIVRFAFGNNHLYAGTQEQSNSLKGGYVVWNLQNDHWTFYRTKADYLIAARQNNYPTPDRFDEFENYYKQHWSGWRFWLLP